MSPCWKKFAHTWEKGKCGCVGAVGGGAGCEGALKVQLLHDLRVRLRLFLRPPERLGRPGEHSCHPMERGVLVLEDRSYGGMRGRSLLRIALSAAMRLLRKKW